MRKIITVRTGVPAVLAVLLMALGASCRSSSLPAEESQKGPAANPADAQSAFPAASAGQARPIVIRLAKNPSPVPTFQLPDLNGKTISTAELRGKVLVLNFWATWCAPCRAEIPELIKLQAQYRDRLQIIGFSMDEAPAKDVKSFVEQNGFNYPVVMANPKVSQDFGGVAALPTSFIVNAQGGVVQKHVGLLPRETYEQEIRSLLGLSVAAQVETFEDTGQIFLKNASRASELPGVDLSGLTEEQKRAVLRRLNTENCNCGCGMTLAQCRINDSGCGISLKLAQDAVSAIKTGAGAGSPQKN